MMMKDQVRLCCLFAAGAVLCAAERDPRAAAMRWADHYAAVYQVPSELVHAIIEVELGWQPHAVSSKGAVGLMQLMPATAASFGVHNRFDIEQNIRGGVIYLARLLRLFDGDLRLVAAAYLAGESRILPAGLQYSNAEVYQYASRIVRLYRKKRLESLQAHILAQNRLEGGSQP
jgi:soluble lytic murein transglycosylase-like protein